MNEVRTTFVPRRPQLATPQVVAPRGPDFIAIVATFLFVASAIAAGGVYAWRLTLRSQIENQAAQLEKEKENFDPTFVQKATLLNDRIEAANQILDRHLAPTELFEIFESFTLRTIAFQTMTATHQADGSIALAATGVGRNFDSVVLQSDWFGDGPADDGAKLGDVVFSKLGTNDRGERTFNFSAVIPADRILFARSLDQLQPASGQRGAPNAGRGTTTPSTATSSPAGTPTSPTPSATGTRAAPPGSVTI